MKQNMSKTAAVCTAILDMLINIGAIYLAILILDYKKHVFTGTTIAVSTICAFVTIIVYFASDMYSSAVLDKLHKVLLKLAGAQLFVLSTGIIVIGMFFSARTEYYKLAFLSVALSFCALALKTVLITKIAHKVRTDAESKKTVLLVGNGKSALEYKKQLEDNPHYGYEVIGCVAERQTDELEWLGGYKDLKAILDEKLEVINLQLAKRSRTTVITIRGILILLCAVIVIIFIALAFMNSPYLDWNYNDPELAVAGTIMHGFEFLFVRLAPIAFLASVVGIVATYKKR